jgi:carboxypeptidase C (cathepsin A)
VTSYFQSALILDQIPPSVAGRRVRLVTYEGGHMYYDRAVSRAAMRAEFGRMLERIRAR